MFPINGFIIICLLTSIAFFFGVVTFLTDYDVNHCEMTFMFEYPQFVKISMKDEDARFEKYGLYAYSEGALTEKAREMNFNGIPVLFIPGNAGAHKQVRSLASIALRKALNSRSPYHFNYFTVDLNEELSGFNGALLYEQAEFVNKSISRVLQLYEGRYNAPKSVILVGHSMGGVIANYILSTLPYNSKLIPLVLTLASPHVRMPILLDPYMESFYKKLGPMYNNNSVLVSISGGYVDMLVPPVLTKGGHIHVASTHVPRSWLPTDHLCILWCKQLVLAINRAMFDSVDIKTKQLFSSPDHILQSFNHHLVKHSGTAVKLASRYSGPVTFNDDDAEWIEYIARQFDVTVYPSKDTKIYMISLFDHPMHEAVTILGLNVDIVEWVFACPAVHVRGNSKICKEGQHLTHKSEITPSIKGKRRMLKINLHRLKEKYESATHVIVRLSSMNKPVSLSVDVYGPGSRKIPVNLPKWWDVRKQTLIKETAENAIHYELVIPDLYHIRQSYLLYVEPLQCKSPLNHHATATIKTPWGTQSQHAFFTETEKKPLHLRLYTSKPSGYEKSSAKVLLTLDPSCRYTVVVKSSIPGVLSNFARYYTPLLVANIVAILLLMLRCQMQSIQANERCSFFFTALKEGAKPYYILTIVKLSSKILSIPRIASYMPLNDWKILEDEGSEFLWLPPILYLCSVGIVWILGANLTISLILCESTVHKFIMKFFAKSMTGTATWSDWLMGNLQKLPLLVASVLIMISWSSCGALALCLGTFFYFLKITQMSQDVIESLVWRIVKACGNRMKSLFTRKKKEAQPTIESTEETNDIKNVAKRNVLEWCQKSLSQEQQQIKSEENKCDEKEGSSGEEVKSSTSDDKVGDEQNKESVKQRKPAKNKDELEEVNKTKSAEETKQKNKKCNIDSKTNDIDKKEDNNSNNNNTNVSGWFAEIFENNELYFHITMFMLWTAVAILNAPIVLTWARNYKYSRTLNPDPSFMPGIIMSSCGIFLWQFEFPKVEKLFYKELGIFIYSAAVVCLLFGIVTAYRLTYTLMVVIAVVIAHQILAPSKPKQEPNVAEENGETEEPEQSYDNVKAKWE